MHSIKQFYNKTLNYDIINKFLYKKTRNLPKLKRAILQFRTFDNNIRCLSSNLLALERVANQKGKFILINNITNKQKTSLGCYLVLQKSNLFIFLEKLVLEILPQKKVEFKKLRLTNVWNEIVYNLTISETSCFSALQNHYFFFQDLPELWIKLISLCSCKKTFMFILKSLKMYA